MRSALISTKPFIFDLFLVGVTVQSAESLSPAIPLGTSTKRANSKRANHGRSRLFQDAASSVSSWLRSFSVCGWRTRCLQCLGIQHTEAAFVDDSCACCGRMNMTSLRSRLSFLKGLAPSAATRSGLSGSSRGPPAGALGDLRVTVRASLPGSSPRTSYSSRSERPVRLPGDFAGSSHGMASISFGAPPEDSMSIAASGDGLTSSEDEGAVGLPPRVLSPLPHRTQSWWPCLRGQPRASGWRSTDHPVPSPRGWMIGFSERDAAHNRALLRCLSSRRCTRSWRSPGWPLSRPEAARLSPPSSLPSTAGLPGGTRAFPRWRRAVAVHLCHETLLSQPKLIVLRARQPLPLHAMAILQVHQAKALKEMHEDSSDPGLMQELRTATDLTLRAMKVTARSLGKAMSTMVVQERHLWLDLAEMKDSSWRTPISQAGLFGDTVEGFAQQFSAVQKQTEGDPAHPATAGCSGSCGCP